MGAKLIPVIVLSLPRATDRRAHIQVQLNSLGVPFTFIDATDWRMFSQQGIAALAAEFDARPIARDNFRAWLPGELANMMSFRRILERIENGNDEFVCVLEDDAVLSCAFKNFLDETTLCSFPHFDILRLQSSYLGRHLPVARVDDIEVVAPYRMGPLSFAQIFTREASHYLRLRTTPAYAPFDIMLYMDRRFASLRILDVTPAVAIQGSFPSSIDEDGVRCAPADLTLIKKLRTWTFLTGCDLRVHFGLASAWGFGARRRLRFKEHRVA